VASGTSDGLLFVAVPVASGGSVHGAVRIAVPLGDVNNRIRAHVLRLLAIAAVVLAVVAAVGWLLARSVTRPLRALADAARRAGGGELDARADAGVGPPEMREVARAFNEMVGRLGELLSVQEAFVADASHQLRTPLTALRLRLENGDLDGALGEAERLSQLVDALLALARAEAAPAESIDLAVLVDDRLDVWRPVADEHGVVLEADVRGAALAAPDRLAQVLDNLLDNALTAAPPGSIVTVWGDAGALHVRDLGPGMSADDRARAFDRFWSKGGGSGLGLAIARRLLEIDGGTIDLRTPAEGGLDVVLCLRPAAIVRPGTAAATAVPR
jgi:signal transduction histidine kinase